MKVGFCTLVNEGYVPGLIALLNSLTYTNPTIDLPFLVYLDKTLPPHVQASIERCYGNVAFEQIDESSYGQCQFDGYRSWGMNPAYRYEIFKNEEFDQLIYIDADMLVVGDIGPLLSFSGALGACRLPPGEGMELKKIGGFNAGLLNIGREVRTPEVWRLLLEVAESEAWTGNQTVLNLVLESHFEELPAQYNVGTSHMTEASLASARILHFLGKKKPWEPVPFDHYQLAGAGPEMCDRLLKLWRQFENVKQYPD
nr:glycosyltransferase [uncultured Duganella sp.]